MDPKPHLRWVGRSATRPPDHMKPADGHPLEHPILGGSSSASSASSSSSASSTSSGGNSSSSASSGASSSKLHDLASQARASNQKKLVGSQPSDPGGRGRLTRLARWAAANSSSRASMEERWTKKDQAKAQQAEDDRKSEEERRKRIATSIQTIRGQKG